jgi:hypothetical protein
MQESTVEHRYETFFPRSDIVRFLIFVPCKLEAEWSLMTKKYDKFCRYSHVLAINHDRYKGVVPSQNLTVGQNISEIYNIAIGIAFESFINLKSSYGGSTLRCR